MKVVGVAVSRVTGGSGVNDGPVVGLGVIVLVGVFVFSPIFVGVNVKVGVGTVGEAAGVRVAVKITTGVLVEISFWGNRFPGSAKTQPVKKRPIVPTRISFLDLMPAAGVRTIPDLISQGNQHFIIGLLISRVNIGSFFFQAG
jgi:hypothetical protein